MVEAKDQAGKPVPVSVGSGSKVSNGPRPFPKFTLPTGWHNSPRDLARHNYFSRGKGICGLLGEHHFHYVYPVMMDDHSTYLIRAMKSGETTPTYFVWDPIVGTIFKIKNTYRDLQTIVDTMGRSVLALDMVELGEAVKLGDADSTTTPEVPKSTGTRGSHQKLEMVETAADEVCEPQ